MACLVQQALCFGVVDVLVCLMIWCGQSFNAVDVSARSMFRHGQCFGVVHFLERLMFEVPQGLSLTSTIEVSVLTMR